MAPAMRTTTKMSRKPRKSLSRLFLMKVVEDPRRPLVVQAGQDEAGDDGDEADDLFDEPLEDAEDRGQDQDDQQDEIEPVHAAPPLLSFSRSTIP